MQLLRTIFYSRNKVKITGGSMRDLARDILASCTTYNPTSGLTGALAFNEQFFCQVMEGDREMISRQMWKLAADNRHDEMVLLAAYTIDQRRFQGWAVAYAGHSDELDPIYLRYNSVMELNPARMTAQSVLELLSDLTELDTHFVQRSSLASAAIARSAAPAQVAAR